MEPQPDQKSLLNQLRIDRSEPSPSTAKPLKWFVLIALAGGVAFALWFLPWPEDAPLSPVPTALAEAIAPRNSDASVLDATGYVVARRQATVSSKTTGKVLEVLIEEGVHVQAGQLLARLDDSVPKAQLELAASQLESARRSLLEIEAQLKQGQLDLARSLELAERELVSQADLDRNRLAVEEMTARLDRMRQDAVVAERALAVQRQIVEDMQIRAPFAGVVIAKAAQPGEMISPVSAGGGYTRTGICTIVDMDSLEVEVDVNEAYINRVYPGQPVSITLNAYPEDAYAAAVIAIIPAAERSKATVRVRVGFSERDGRVLPDMGVRVAFLETGTEAVEAPVEAGVLVPKEAVVREGASSYVLVVTGDEARRRPIRVDGGQGAKVRVVAGLDAGERVVARPDESLLASLASAGRVSLPH
ncbi:MAG: efflux RND transporter periplasmic adaptor subunit [Gammaproteobacteria bacterium]|nr:efflux RND transporter periplasmic adaptor subunit [Gammaproteobacteria bacterium]MYF48633.1 efflux RND transporter periplasmic adaptor subunit [Gammaproteobacteria bacterium]